VRLPETVGDAANKQYGYRDAFVVIRSWSRLQRSATSQEPIPLRDGARAGVLSGRLPGLGGLGSLCWHDYPNYSW
jgi:hypothetical protein